MLRPVLRCIGVCTHHHGALKTSQYPLRRLSNSRSRFPAGRAITRNYCTSSAVQTRDMAVDVTRDNFQAMLPAIAEALEKCAFFAFDCEMTGLFTDGNKHEYLDDIQARYAKMAESSKAYIITQYGLSCFEATGPSSYQARTFNFYVFPQPHGNYNRRFLCDASSLVFLAEHGFDFNKCISKGVPYMPVRTRDFQLLQVNRSNEPRGDPVVVTSDEDKAFVAELIQMVTDWLASTPPTNSDTAGGPGAGANGAAANREEDPMSVDGSATADEDAAAVQQTYQELVLPPVNSYKRLLAYQELRKPQFGVEGHPGFWVKKAASRSLVLVRATAQQAEQYEATARADRIAAIHEAAGFAAVFDLMRHSNKPAVGHNCMFDVAYGIFSFADSFLPGTWRDFKKMACSWHPGGIWDTKYLSKQLPEVFEGNTSLAEVYTLLVEGGQANGTLQLLQAASDAAGVPITLPSITHAPGFDKYRSLKGGEAAHEAGYDAYMTGAAFACLLPLAVGKMAADPSSELAVAHRAALEREAAAAAAKAARAPGATTPLTNDSQQHYSVSPVALGLPALRQEASEQQQQCEPQQTMEQPDHAQQQQHDVLQLQPPQKAGDLLQYLQGVRGRLNVTFTDMEYAALSEADPIPLRPYTFQLSGLQPGYRTDDVWKMLLRQGLGSARITPLDSSSCLAEFRPEVAPIVASTFADMDGTVIAMPWAEYALMRYNHQVPEPEAAAAAIAAAADSANHRGMKRARLEEQRGQQQQQQEQQQQRGASSRRGGSRPVAENVSDSQSEEDLEAADQPDKGSCRLM